MCHVQWEVSESFHHFHLSCAGVFFGQVQASSSRVSASRRDRHTTATSRGGAACGNDTDCSLLGTCVAGACQCHAGFTSPTCGVLDLLPISTSVDFTAAFDDVATGEHRLAPRSLPGVVWPQTGGPNASAWGFTVAYVRLLLCVSASLCFFAQSQRV